uniref:Uncharacterized protein n=1 Tax=Meloidogyne enterolobii TaxID=390850 RepID=A0A6V7UKX8_MELEN|nr:unnamed protein product [Meloidogyne enterolobii]
MKISSRSRADLIRCVDCICSSILKNDLNISDLLDEGDNLFYLNSEDEKLPIPKSVIIAFQRLYLKLNSEISALNSDCSNNEVDPHLLQLLGSDSLARLTSWLSHERRVSSNKSQEPESADSESLPKAEERHGIAPKHLENKNHVQTQTIKTCKLGFKSIEAVSISPRLPLTSDVYTQTFEKSIDLKNVSMQATIPLIDQATSPLIDNNKEPNLKSPQVSQQNEEPNSDKSISTLLTPSSNMQQSTDLSSSGQLDEAKAISLFSRNRVVVYNISSDGGIVKEQQKAKFFNNYSTSSEKSNTDNCDDEIESISISDMCSKNTRQNRHQIFGCGDSSKLDLTNLKELTEEDCESIALKNVLEEKTPTKAGARRAKIFQIGMDEEEEPSTLNQITPIPNNFEFSS